jgi:hypothetical protein
MRLQKKYLCGVDNRITLLKAIEQADEWCGSCKFDPLYKRALELL